LMISALEFAQNREKMTIRAYSQEYPFSAPRPSASLLCTYLIQGHNTGL